MLMPFSLIDLFVSLDFLTLSIAKIDNVHYSFHPLLLSSITLAAWIASAVLSDEVDLKFTWHPWLAETDSAWRSAQLRAARAAALRPNCRTRRLDTLNNFIVRD